MHRYSQDIYKRVLDSSGWPKGRDENIARRFAMQCYKEAPSCKCGCGERVLPNVKKRSIASQANVFSKGWKIEFCEYVKYHDRMKVRANYKPSEKEHQYIIAAILGDGCLIKPYRNAVSHRICWNMGNRKHAKSKLKSMDFVGANYYEGNNPGFGDNWYRVATSAHPIFTSYAKKYGDSKGLIGDSGIAYELDSIGWAIYYGDDGHLNADNKIAFIHTEGKTHEMVEHIRKALNLFIGFDGARVYEYIGGAKKRKMKAIRMTKGGTHEFIKKIKKYMEDGLEYKTRGFN